MQKLFSNFREAKYLELTRPILSQNVRNKRYDINVD